MDYDSWRPQLAAPLNAKENVPKTATAVGVGDYLRDEMEVGKGKFKSKIN